MSPEAGFMQDRGEAGSPVKIRKEKEKSYAKKERDGLVLPYDSERFAGVWRELADSPKWRGKTERSLQYALNQLGKFEEEFAVCLMEAAVVERLAGSGVCGYGAEVSEVEGRTIGARRQCQAFFPFC